MRMCLITSLHACVLSLELLTVRERGQRFSSLTGAVGERKTLEAKELARTNETGAAPKEPPRFRHFGCARLRKRASFG
jgi:hypothetical protein